MGWNLTQHSDIKPGKFTSMAALLRLRRSALLSLAAGIGGVSIPLTGSGAIRLPSGQADSIGLPAALVAEARGPSGVPKAALAVRVSRCSTRRAMSG